MSKAVAFHLAAMLVFPISAHPQVSDPLHHITHSATLTVLRRDSTCVQGTLKSADASAITLALPDPKPSVTITRYDILRVSDGDMPLYSARSSWHDVEHAHLYPRESLLLTLKSGKQVTGRPIKTTKDNITLHHAFATTSFAKADISTADYIRNKPTSNDMQYIDQEAPWLLIFDPEFYYRASGLAGRLRVRLYDASRPEEDEPLSCKS